MALEQFQNQDQTPAIDEAVQATSQVEKKPETKEALYSSDALRRLHTQQLAYNQHLQKMIDSFQTRQQRLNYDPQLMGLAEGLLSDTPFFGVAAGKGFKGYREAGDQAEKNRIEDMKVQNELLGEQLKGTQGEVALERQLIGDKMFRDIFGRGQGSLAQGASDLDTQFKIDKFVKDAQVGDIDIRPEDIAAVAQYDEKKGALLEKMYDNQQNAKKIEQGEYGNVKRFLPVLNEASDQLTVRQGRAIDKLVARNAPDEDFLKFYQQEGIIAKPTKGQIATSETIEGPATKARRAEVEKLTDVEANKNKLELQKGDIKEATDDSKLASNVALSGQQMFNIASNDATKGMFGKLAKKGWDKVFLTALKEPVRVGNTSIGVGNIEELVIMAGGNQDEIDAAKQFKKPASEAELAYTRIYLAKQGAVTEGERAIVRNIMPSISDPAKVVQLKAELLIAKSQFDMQKADLFNQYVNTHKLGTMADFMGSSDYKKLYNAYATHTADIANEYMPGAVKEAIPTKGKPTTSSNREAGPLEQSILGQQP
jgi:hypothetical protein